MAGPARGLGRAARLCRPAGAMAGPRADPPRHRDPRDPPSPRAPAGRASVLVAPTATFRGVHAPSP